MTVAAAATHLMFQGDGEAAVAFYEATVPGFALGAVTRAGPDGERPEGTFETARADIAGHRLVIFDSPPVHDFGFTPAMSLMLTVGANALDALADALAEGGSVMMPPGDYGFADRFAWMADRFGVSWQLTTGD
ncbi:MAG: VOC family protein [Paracoccaceae bacterium]